MAEKEIKSSASIIYGTAKSLLFSLVLTALLIFAISAAYLVLEVSEKTASLLVTLSAVTSVFLASALGARKIKRRGLILGTATGAAYALTLYLTGFLAFGFPGLNKGLMSTAALLMLGGAAGGIVGVNIKRRK